MALEPVGLAVLAEALRDGTWLDMRIVEGRAATLERVRVDAIIVRRADEEIELSQESAELNDGEQVVFTSNHRVPAEAIRWARPTAFNDATEVRAYNPATATGERPDPDLYLAAVAVASAQSSVLDGETVLRLAREGDLHWRYWLMLVVKETTDLAPGQITRLFGYRSPQPLVSARRKYARDGQDMRELKRIVKRVERLRGVA